MLYVTGATGHSGSWFLKRLESEKYQGKIRCVIRNSLESSPEKYSIFSNINLDIEFVVGDLNDEEFLKESLQDVYTILHIASISLTPKIIAAAINNGVKWAILVHTTGRYSKFKGASEEYIKIEDEILELCKINSDGKRIMNCTVLRPTMIYGSSRDRNMYRLVEYLSKHRFFPLFGDGSNLMQPVHARDLGNAYFDVLTHPEITMNKSYNLSGKLPLTYLEIIKTISRKFNKKVYVISIPISISIFAAKVYNCLSKSAIITVEQVMRMQEDKAFYHDDATHDFGYNPLTFNEGIEEEIKEFLSGTRVDYSGVKY